MATENTIETENKEVESSTTPKTENTEQVDPMLKIAEGVFDKLNKPEADSSTEEAPEGAGQKKTQTEEEASTKETEKSATEDQEENAESTEDDTAKLEQENKIEQEREREGFIPRKRFDEVNEQLQKSKPVAERFVKFNEWVSQAGLDGKEVEEALITRAMRKQNPQEYVKRLQAEIEQVELVTGSKLPKDLQEKVTAGTMAEDDAKELAMLRLKANGGETQMKQTAEQMQQQWVQNMSHTLSSWAQSKMQLDPDFRPKVKPTDKDGKFEDFLVRFTALTQQRPPQSFADVTMLAEAALKDTDEMIKRYRPALQKKKVLTDTSSSTKNKSTPKSYDEVVESVARKHGIG